MPPPLVIQEQHPPGATVAERLEAAVAAGYDGLELLDADPGRLPELEPLVRDGARLATATPSLGGWLGDFDAGGRRRAIEGLRRQLDGIAAAAGVVLLFEPLNRYEDHMVNTVAQAAELVRASGSPGVRLLADTYHMNIEEDDICAALRAAGALLGAVHLSDSNRHQPGSGHVPFPAVLDTLAEIGFAGVLSVECRLRGEPGAAVAASGRYLRGLLDR